MNKLRHYVEIENKFVSNFIKDATAFMENNDVKDMLEIIESKNNQKTDIRAVSYEIATIMEVVIRTLLKQSRPNGCPRYSYLVLETSGKLEEYDFIDDVATVYGMSKQNVYNICGGKVAYPRGIVVGIYTDESRKNERKNARGDGPKTKYSDEDIVRAMLATENDYEAAAEILGCHTNTIRRRWRTLCQTKNPDLE